jgi:putative transposase
MKTVWSHSNSTTKKNKNYTYMPINKKYLADFEPGKFYHVYNRTNNKETLFRNEENYKFFLKRYHHYLNPFVETYSWCLLTNHFHLLIKVMEEAVIRKYLLQFDQNTLHQTEQKYLNNEIDTSILLEQCFKRLFQSYTLSFNKVFKRQGNLFYKTFKRIEIMTEQQLIQTIIYINNNAIKHGLVKQNTIYPWSSYATIISNKPTNLKRKEVMALFGNEEAFASAHKMKPTNMYTDNNKIENE